MKPIIIAVVITCFLSLLAATRAASPLPVEGLPDLIVELSGPPNAKAGRNIGRTIKLIAKNVGAAPAAGSLGTLDPGAGYRIDYMLSTDEIVPIKFARYSPHFSEDVLLRGGRVSRTVDLAPSASKQYLNGAGIPADAPAGDYFICAVIDPGGKVTESNEENNVSCIPIKVER